MGKAGAGGGGSGVWVELRKDLAELCFSSEIWHHGEGLQGARGLREACESPRGGSEGILRGLLWGESVGMPEGRFRVGVCGAFEGRARGYSE